VRLFLSSRDERVEIVMIGRQKARSCLVKALLVALGGGTMFAGCETRVKDSVVGGFRQVILSPQTATLVVQALVPVDGNDSGQ